MLGDATIWMNLSQFINFGSTSPLPGPVLQQRYPPLYSMYNAIQTACGGQNSGLDFGDACKMLILNNVEGLASKVMMELHTSAKLKKNTHSICAGSFHTVLPCLIPTCH